MSILVKGVKMPRCCEVCPFNYDYYRCEALGDRFDDREEIDMETQRLPDCPLVEVLGRLIDVDKIFNALRISKDIDDESKAKFIGLLIESPTVMEAEEQEE